MLRVTITSCNQNSVADVCDLIRKRRHLIITVVVGGSVVHVPRLLLTRGLGCCMFLPGLSAAS